MTTLLDIGAVLRAERKKQKRYQKEVAEGASVHRNTLADLETGTANVELKTLIAVCEQLGLDIRIVAKEIPGIVGAANTQQSELGQVINKKRGTRSRQI